MSISYAYFISGALVIVGACWLCYGLNDVHEQQKQDREEEAAAA